jgi:hypothetical protein
MDYFVGAVVTFVILIIFRFFVNKEINQSNKIEISYSQTNVYELIRDYMPKISRQKKDTQASKYNSKLYLKIFVVGKNAYWIKENTFYMADIVEDEIDQDTTRPVDTMSMDKVQLNEMMFIVEKLTKGNTNDSWNSR